MFDETGDPCAGEGRTLRSLLARAGLAGVPPAVLTGVAVLIVAALALAGWRLGTIATDRSDDGFAFESGDGGVDSPEVDTGGASGDDIDDHNEVAETLWVHVAGAVSVPGLLELPGGSRVGDAIDAAGGSLPDAALEAVNLARLLGDGEQVYVPTVEEVASGIAPPAAGGPDGGPGGGPSAGDAGVDINAASEAELVALPGVGPATAGKIIADREANGPFSTPEDIMRVSGIGEKKFESMRDLIVVR